MPDYEFDVVVTKAYNVRVAELIFLVRSPILLVHLCLHLFTYICSRRNDNVCHMSTLIYKCYKFIFHGYLVFFKCIR